MTFVFMDRAAVDEELGLRLENDLTFRDSTIPALKLTNLRSGHQWLLPTPTISEPITFETPAGSVTRNLDVGVRLQSRVVRPIVADVAQVLSAQGHPIDNARATAILEDALRTFFMRGGEMRRFFEYFRIEWICDPAQAG